jgi:transcriptional regulator with XRE-family HTH domain
MCTGASSDVRSLTRGRTREHASSSVRAQPDASLTRLHTCATVRTGDVRARDSAPRGATMDTGRNAERLDEAMRQRRVQLGLSWEDIAAAADITSAHLRRIRTGQYLPRDTTAAKLERAFRWSAGSIDAVLAGGEPTPLPTRRLRPPTRSDWTNHRARRPRGRRHGRDRPLEANYRRRCSGSSGACHRRSASASSKNSGTDASGTRQAGIWKWDVRPKSQTNCLHPVNTSNLTHVKHP